MIGYILAAVCGGLVTVGVIALSTYIYYLKNRHKLERRLRHDVFGDGVTRLTAVNDNSLRRPVKFKFCDECHDRMVALASEHYESPD